MTRFFNRLLQSLLDLAGSKAMPSDNLTTIFQGNSVYDETLTAPADGYYSIDATNNTDATTLIQGSVLSYISGRNRQAVYIPCRKGQSIRIATNATNNVIIRFRTLQGGGNFNLQRRHGLCALKIVSFNSLSLQALKLIRMTLAEKLTSLQARLSQLMMATCLSVQKAALVLKPSLILGAELPCRAMAQTKLMLESLYLVPKVKQYTALIKDRATSVVLFHQKVLANPCLNGGVL